MQGLLLQGLLLLAGGSRLKVHAATEDLCYWIEEGHSWKNGLKATLNVQLDKDYEDWQVKFLYDTDVVNLEAWKGDVASLSQREFTITSRCYNNKLFACQVLSFGYVLRHFPEDEPNFDLQLNNATVPLCNDTNSSLAAPATTPPCPYEGMLEGTLHCSLWQELKSFQDRDATTSAPNGVSLGPGVSPSGDTGTAPNGTPLGPGVSPNGSPVTPPGVAPNGVPLGPGVSPNGDTGTAPNGTPLGPGVSPNGSPATPPGIAPNGVPLGPGVSPNGDTGTAPNGTPL